MEAKPLVVIVGPTASGKTSLAIELAKKFNGEIICADSRTVYKGMDIGTAKPSIEEQSGVKHWGIDLVEPNQRYTAADFKDYAQKKVYEIRSRGHTPFLVGGSGLYVDAVLFDYKFGPPPDSKLRDALGEATVEELNTYCIKHNIALPENVNNKRYLIRAIEQEGVNKQSETSPVNNSFIVGITTDRVELRKQIEARADVMLAGGATEEAKRLGDKYGWDTESMTSNIYPICKLYIEGTITTEDARQRFISQDWHLAKRQLTWFRRNRYIHWATLADARHMIADLLDSEH